MIEPPARAPGRPRNENADRRIIEATLRLLSTEGYDRTSIESVAAEETAHPSEHALRDLAALTYDGAVRAAAQTNERYATHRSSMPPS